MINPTEGGSYSRNADGSLTRIEVDASAAIKSETPSAEKTTETPDVGDGTSVKKGKT